MAQTIPVLSSYLTSKIEQQICSICKNVKYSRVETAQQKLTNTVN